MKTIYFIFSIAIKYLSYSLIHDIKGSDLLDESSCQLNQRRVCILDILKDVKNSLNIFMTIEAENLTESKDITRDFLLNKENYQRFENAQVELVKLKDELIPKTNSNRKKKNNLIIFYINLIENEIHKIFTKAYTDILACFLSIYVSLYSNEIQITDPKTHENFTLALPQILNTIHFLFYLEFNKITDIEVYLKHEKEYSCNESISNIFWINNFYIETNYQLLVKLLIVLSDYNHRYSLIESTLELENPIESCFIALKNARFKTYKMKRTWVSIFNELFIKYFDLSGLIILNIESDGELFFYDESLHELKVVVYKDMVIRSYAYECVNRNYDKKSIYLLSKNPIKIISMIFQLFETNYRRQIIVLLYNFFFKMLYHKEFSQIETLWAFISGQYSKFYFEAFSEDFMTFVAKEIANFSGVHGELFFNLDIQIQLERLLAFCCLIETRYNLYDVKKLITQCLDLFSGKNNSLPKKYSDTSTSWEYLNYVLEMSKYLEADSLKQKYFSVLEKRLTQLLTETTHVSIPVQWYFSPYLNQIGSFINILGRNIASYNFSMIVKFLENIIYNHEVFISIHTRANIMEEFFICICKFLFMDDEKNQILCKEFIEKIGNLILRNFFNFINLEIDLKDKSEMNIHKKLSIIINSLFERNYSQLEFHLYSEKYNPLLDYSKSHKFLDKKSSFKSSVKDITLVNELFYKRSINDINTFITDVLQISLQLSLNFHNLTQCNAYFMLDKCESISYYCDFEELLIKNNYLQIEKNDRIKDVFISGEKDTDSNDIYKIVMGVYLDFIITVRRCKCNKILTNDQLVNMIECINHLNTRINAEKKYHVETFNLDECVIFFDVIKFINELYYLPNFNNRRYDDLLKLLYTAAFSVCRKVHKILSDNKKYEQSFAISFRYLNLFTEDSEEVCAITTRIISYEQIDLCLDESYPKYFISNLVEERLEILRLNALFYQFISYLKLQIPKTIGNQHWPFPILANEELKTDSILPIAFDFVPSTYTDQQPMCYMCLDFTKLLTTFLEKYPGIKKFIFFACIKKLEITVDYNDVNILLCYMILKSLFKLSDQSIIAFQDYDHLLAQHIENATSKDNFFALCDIATVYQRLYERKKIHEFSSYKSAFITYKKKNWSHYYLS